MKISTVFVASIILLVATVAGNAASLEEQRQFVNENRPVMKRFLRPHMFSVEPQYLIETEQQEILNELNKKKEMVRMREEAAIELYLKLMKDLKFYL